ncbi:flagellar biosynthesis anti-sigma factor FlgM [Alicyclobacillus sp. SO9]|uniref:flagellar biosynthesis anti-sigma factor FlgM n=1 Tax=Alicyclobacillus sp. SO9 TaxID=2665646 RepID=UPI0018E80C41|nr:flagellar biosynthesis anti-sigma factor FlgM [Alicyclobacillus sp. SO9]QQE78118.1 flagellar biosynthesis anti-sigma factor FlgM [Alicyclobacillus sp. SO9]
MMSSNINPSHNNPIANDKSVNGTYNNKTAKKTRTEFLAELKSQIQNGQYQPNLESLASKILSSGTLK